MEEKRIALLIDSDNISADYIDIILDKINEEGITTYRRIYGDWTRPEASKWKRVLLENSITPIQQYNNTVGKNSTDSALIIDAMDILYTGKVDAFCIVSSDSDFTRLASRLREENMMVIGMGEDKTPTSLIAAYNKFFNLSSFKKSAEREKGSQPDRDKRNIIAPRTIERRVRGIIIANNDRDRQTSLGEIGSRLQNRWADFDVTNYGVDTLSDLLRTFKSIRLVKDGSRVNVELRTK
ncbi:MAG: NYN domain-containing protein [Anaerovoracaceae bacterium]|jgi:hypothetical protein